MDKRDSMEMFAAVVDFSIVTFVLVITAWKESHGYQIEHTTSDLTETFKKALHDNAKVHR